MRVKERGPAGIAKTYPTRKLPRGPRLIDDSIQFGSLDPAPPVPLGGRRDLAAGPELCEPVTHENHGQSACSTRLERIDFREPSRADAADGLGEECQADIRDSRIQCVEDVLGRRITSQWRRTRWNRGVRNLFHNWTPGRGVERIQAQADKRLNEWLEQNVTSSARLISSRITSPRCTSIPFTWRTRQCQPGFPGRRAGHQTRPVVAARAGQPWSRSEYGPALRRGRLAIRADFGP